MSNFKYPIKNLSVKIACYRPCLQAGQPAARGQGRIEHIHPISSIQLYFHN